MMYILVHYQIYGALKWIYYKGFVSTATIFTFYFFCRFVIKIVAYIFHGISMCWMPVVLKQEHNVLRISPAQYSDRFPSFSLITNPWYP